jgi:DNA polymerase
MLGAYDELLDATIQHLESLKSRGVRQVAVSAETLRALAQPVKLSTASFAAPRPAARASAPQITPPLAKKFSAPVEVRRETAGAEAAVNSRSQPRKEEPPVLEGAAKAAALAALRARALACVKCAHLASSRQTVVFGVGNPEAELMFVGEAPGADEDEQGEPFVGRAGELLTKIIQAMGWQRGGVYIANILKCRPDTPGQSSGNRKPTPEEMATCIPFLHEQIDLIRPKVLVALGATAVEGLLGKTAGITKLRGNWRLYRGIPLMPTYHPSYLLHNQAVTEKRKVWEDMLAVMEKLGRPISEKQRNYFLKG